MYKKNNIKSKKKFCWTLALFAIPTIAAAPIISLTSCVTDKNGTYIDARNAFNSYNEEINDTAQLVDSFAKSITKPNQGQAYNKINLKNIFNDISVPLTNMLIKHTSLIEEINDMTINFPDISYLIPEKSIQAMICSFFQNKSPVEILKQFDCTFPTNSNINQTGKLSLAKNIITKTLRSFKEIRNIIAQLPLINLIKQPVINIFDVVSQAVNSINLTIDIQPFTGFLLLSGNVGILDLIGNLPSFAIKSGLITNLANTYKLNLNESDLKTICDTLYPFNPLPTNYTNYPTDPNNPTQSGVSPSQTKVSVGFNVANCAYINLVSPQLFIDSFTDCFLNYSTIAQITPELIQTLSLGGIIIDSSNVNNFVQTKLIKTDVNNPYLEMNICSDATGQIPIQNNVTTYISLKNLTMNGADKNWLGSANYQGGLFSVSLYDTLLGNKNLIKALINIGFAIKNNFFLSQITTLINMTLKTNKVLIANKTNASPKQTSEQTATLINEFIDKLNINGENIYNLINSTIGKIEATQNYKFSETWVANSSPYAITYDESTKQCTFKRTYNFGTSSQSNGIGNIDLTPLKNLLGNITLLDAANIAKLFVNFDLGGSEILLSTMKVNDCLSTKLLIPSSLSFTETLLPPTDKNLKSSQNTINITQVIDLSGMKDLFDNIFGLNIGGKNPKQNSLFSDSVTKIIGMYKNALVNEKDNSYVFNVITTNLTISFKNQNIKY